MVFQHLVVQQFVAVVQLFEQQIAAQIRCHALQLMPHPVGLFVEREHRRRKPTGQAQPSPLFVREADTAIQARRANAAGIRGAQGSLITTSLRCLGTSGHGSADLGERNERILKSA